MLRGCDEVIAEDIYPPKIDWKQILADLRDHGCSGYRAARLTGMSWSAIQNLRDHEGSDPHYGHGRALLRLHARFCGAALTTRRQSESEFVE